MRTQIVLFDGFDPLDVIAPLEVLTAGGTAVELASAEGAREVPSGLDTVSLTATTTITPSTVDVILVPGAAGRVDGTGDDSVPAILARTLGTPLPGLLKEALDRTGLTVATVCGGSSLLAMAGLIAGRHATTHHLGLEPLGASGVHVTDARVVDDGDLVTGGAVTS